MSYKRLIPCIFIAEGKAVKWFDDKSVLSEDVIGLSKIYSENGADELLVFDLSQDDDEHEEAIDLHSHSLSLSAIRPTGSPSSSMPPRYEAPSS